MGQFHANLMYFLDQLFTVEQVEEINSRNHIRWIAPEEIIKILPQSGRAMKLSIDKGAMLLTPKEDSGLRSQLFAFKFVLPGDPDLEGHFPGKPIYPGYAIRECNNLTGALMAKFIKPELKGLPIVREEGVAKYRTTLVPGDVAIIHVTMTGLKMDRRATTATFFGEVRKLNDGRDLVATFGETKGVLL